MPCQTHGVLTDFMCHLGQAMHPIVWFNTSLDDAAKNSKMSLTFAIG